MKDPASGEEIQLQSADEARVLLGPLDSNARLIRDLHGVSLLLRDGSMRLMGRSQAVDLVRRVLETGLEKLRRGQTVTPAEIADELRGTQPASQDPGAEEGAEPRPRGNGHASVKARSAGQARYLRDLEENDVVFAVGPAGTGKTYLAVAAALAAAKDGLVRRIILVRPAVEAGEKLGFLPGDFQAKVDPYMRPLYDALHDLLDPGQRQRYMESDVIEVCPLAYMRGRTLNQSFVILDEAQNTTVAQMMMFLTRLGEESRMVITGDPSQVDLPKVVSSGLADAIRRLKGVPGIKVTRLGTEDIVRHAVVERILKAYGKDKDV